MLRMLCTSAHSSHRTRENQNWKGSTRTNTLQSPLEVKFYIQKHLMWSLGFIGLRNGATMGSSCSSAQHRSPHTPPAHHLPHPGHPKKSLLPHQLSLPRFLSSSHFWNFELSLVVWEMTNFTLPVHTIPLLNQGQEGDLGTFSLCAGQWKGLGEICFPVFEKQLLAGKTKSCIPQ